MLRNDGITYHQYVTELTYLLFLKVAEETGREDKLPEGYRWKDLAEKDGLGDLYEGLLEKNAHEKKSGAGQYFTPRPLIDCMVAVTKPQPGEYIQDPAAGTCGFLVAVDRYIKQNTDDLYNLSEEEQQFQSQKAFYGTEWVRDAQRLALMDLMLHDSEGNLEYGDTLGPKGADLRKAAILRAILIERIGLSVIDRPRRPRSCCRKVKKKMTRFRRKRPGDPTDEKLSLRIRFHDVTLGEKIKEVTRY